MKRLFALLLAALLAFSGCGIQENGEAPTVSEAYESRFESETHIILSDDGIQTDALSVYATNDIIYYEDRETYESGNPYGEGEPSERHSAAEAAAHTVVNITKPGRYRVTGKLSFGQIRVDLGEDAYDDPDAVVELILENADITCTVAPAILFLNVYECDGDWSVDTAKPDVDTSKAGANLILQGENTVSGSYVARIYKDKEGEKKLWKQDGALYSYMSMNVFGPGSLTLNAENEGLDTELHLTIHGGDITIFSGNDGINTNEDGVSVTTIYGGTLRIAAGLGEEGDGIDSNGYLVIHGGTVISAAKPMSDAGLDSDLGSYIHGGTVVALGAAMDWAESDSEQVTMNLQFQQRQQGEIRILRSDGTEVFSFDPAADPCLGAYDRAYQGVILSCPAFQVGDSYEVFAGDTQMMYTSTDVMMRHGGGQRPEGDRPDFPEGERPSMPADWDGEKPGGRGDRQPPEEFDGTMPTMPEGEIPPMPVGGWGEHGGFGGQPGEGGSTVFYMQDKVNFFSGLTAVQ